jgi:hypothetical protein
MVSRLNIDGGRSFMKSYVRALGAAFLAAGMLAVPTAAQAAEADTAKLTALTELTAAGLPVSYPIHPGETVSPVLGVVNSGTETVQGVVVHIRVLNDVDLPKEFTNCQYYVDSNLDGAWCEIGRDLPVGTTFALDPFHVSAAPQAEELSSVIFQWYSKAWAEPQGGIAALAKAHSGQGTTPAAGTGGEIALTAKELPPSPDPKWIGFSYLKLVTPPTTPPTSAPTSAPTSSPTAAPATTVPAGGTGGGTLVITGSRTATVAGVGAVLLAGGAIGLLLARRRRTRFVA